MTRRKRRWLLEHERMRLQRLEARLRLKLDPETALYIVKLHRTELRLGAVGLLLVLLAAFPYGICFAMDQHQAAIGTTVVLALFSVGFALTLGSLGYRIAQVLAVRRKIRRRSEQ